MCGCYIMAVFTVADGLIWLRQSVQRNSMVRKMEIVKMRGQRTLPGLHSFRIDHMGVRVFAPASVVAAGSAGSDTVRGERDCMGVPELDAMLGGGLPRGYSLLVAGPSRSGKSILASAFLAEGARCGETGVVAAFEQHPNRTRNLVLNDLIARGQVGLIDSREPGLSIDEITLLILTEVRRLKASRVVLDSLSGFELALAPTFRTDFRESLLGLVTALARAGVSVLMTSELEHRYTDLRFSPYGAAFLTDAIIVQRYIEIDSRLQRVMAVVKVRATPAVPSACRLRPASRPLPGPQAVGPRHRTRDALGRQPPQHRLGDLLHGRQHLGAAVQPLARRQGLRQRPPPTRPALSRKTSRTRRWQSPCPKR
jgi:circadian clock protein KaiC